MLNQHSCPFCSYTLMSHVRSGKPYWFCLHCHTEIPYGVCNNIVEQVLNQAAERKERLVCTPIQDLVYRQQLENTFN